MPTEEEAYHPGTIVWKNGRATSPLDNLKGLDKFYDNPKRKIRYSTRVIKRREETARQIATAEPTSFEESRGRGLNYYWDSGE